MQMDVCEEPTARGKLLNCTLSQDRSFLWSLQCAALSCIRRLLQTSAAALC